jgi:peptidoglycan glycosyltransferase
VPAEEADIMRIDRPIRNMLNVFVLLFLVVTGFLVYWQVGQADALVKSPYNISTCTADSIPQRGTIYDRNGTKLAYSVKNPDYPCGWQRVYTDPTLAPVLGFYDPTGYGVTGLEAAYNDVLSGTTEPPNTTISEGFSNLISRTAHSPTYGSDIYLTIDDRIQQEAYNEFNDSAHCWVGIEPGTQDGSIIVEDPQTGEILAMVSHPDFDPNKVIDHDPAPDGATAPDGTPLTVGQEYWENDIINNPLLPLIDRPLADAEVPGSSFKTLTLIAAFDSGQFTPQSTFTKDQATDYLVDGFDISTNNLNYYQNEPAASTFPMDIIHTYAYSDNVVFARVATTLGAQTWLDYASRFGISYGDHVTNIPFDLPVAHSWVYQPGVNFDEVELANVGYGQGTLQITPLVMSVMVSAVAADGAIYAPHLLLKTVPHGTSASSVAAAGRELVTQGMSPAAAQGVRLGMKAVVQYGSVGNSGPGISYIKTSPTMQGGKTGTAQVGVNQFPQTWYISLAPDDTTNPTGDPPKLVVIVQKEFDGEGACQAPVSDHILTDALPLVGYPLSASSGG